MALVALQSKDHREILDIVDRLRSKGVGRYVDLPEIIVCGDQSAGKSSVLEAISGMSFPTKDNLCTRFATELVLRRDPDFSVRVSINPGPERSAAEKEQLARFQLEMGAQAPDLGQVVDKAKEAMGLSDSKQFSTDTLRVELSGPSQPHLTMVDLPGLFRAGNSEQSMDDAKTVHDMVHGYMKRPRSIILAVVSAKSDFALQDVTELARELDPSGSRTIGLITKPDTLDVGSDSERSYVKLAQNQDVVFRLGWHVLKNRNYEMRDAPSAERDDAEEKFFATGIWTSLSPTHLGIRALVPRLSNVLKDQILDQLPGLLADTEAGISDCRSQLDRLGTSRATTDEQRRYLLQVSQEFSSFMKDAVDGVYNDPFFGSARTDDGYEKRLRAVVQNSLIDFREDMKVDGETRLIVEPESSSSYPSFRAISRAKYVQQVKALMDRNRGCELSGTFNPLIVGELFTEQCQPWSGITQAAKETIVDAVYRTTRAILKHCTVEETTDSLFRIIHGSIDNLKRNVNNKVDELLRPHYEGHPITYNHYLTDNVQKAQAGRRRKQMEEVILKQLKLPEIKSFHAANFSPLTLLNALEERTEVDMELHAGELAVDYMQAYYKVALKTFVDEFSTLAIENCLIRELPSLFSPQRVYDLGEDDVATLAAESEAAVVMRAACSEKLEILEAASQDLKRLNKHSAATFDPQKHYDGNSNDNDVSVADGATSSSRFVEQDDHEPDVESVPLPVPMLEEKAGTAGDDFSSSLPSNNIKRRWKQSVQ